MAIRGEQIGKVATKLGFNIRPGSKHILVLNEQTLITTIPRGKIRDGRMKSTIKILGISSTDAATIYRSKLLIRYLQKRLTATDKGYQNELRLKSESRLSKGTI